jgi:hypothetical protein
MTVTTGSSQGHLDYSSSKNPLKETKILSDFITDLKFQHKPKYHLSKILV